MFTVPWGQSSIALVDLAGSSSAAVDGSSVVDCLDAELLEAFEVVLHPLKDVGACPSQSVSSPATRTGVARAIRIRRVAGEPLVRLVRVVLDGAGWPDNADPAGAVAGIDSGSLLLGAAGLIDGRPATTHRANCEPLEPWVEVIDARIVDDGDLVTCGIGWFAGLDLADGLLERELGAAAEIVALEQWTGRDRQGTVWRRS
jgi:hypothetical protein